MKCFRIARMAALVVIVTLAPVLAYAGVKLPTGGYSQTTQTGPFSPPTGGGSGWFNGDAGEMTFTDGKTYQYEWNSGSNRYDIELNGVVVGFADYELNTAGPPPQYHVQNYDSAGNPTKIGNATKKT